MSNPQPSGWRALKPSQAMVTEPDTADKQHLFDAARVAGRVLNLPSSCRFVLDQLCGVYGGDLVENRILVWPSNEYLTERTGIAERTVRFALARLIEEGLILGKDSPNGKRYAQRSPRGQIVKAYGFDLSPLLDRIPEFRARLAAIKDAERERAATFDDLTIHRRATQEALRSIAEQYPETDISDLTKRALELARLSPRRSAMGSADAARDAWLTIRKEAEARYFTACAGNNCRHKDTNKYTPDQSCNNRTENIGESERSDPATSAEDLAAACPDAMEFLGPIRSDRDFVAAVTRMRGPFGVSLSAWDDAAREIGPLGAAGTLIYVVQMQMRPAPGSDPIKNAGGYFRALVRLIQSGKVDLSKEIRRLCGRP